MARRGEYRSGVKFNRGRLTALQWVSKLYRELDKIHNGKRTGAGASTSATAARARKTGRPQHMRVPAGNGREIDIAPAVAPPPSMVDPTWREAQGDDLPDWSEVVDPEAWGPYKEVDQFFEFF